MISITKREAELIRATAPEVPITRTMRQKSKRHHYYMAEESIGVEIIARERKVRPSELVK